MPSRHPCQRCKQHHTQAKFNWLCRPCRQLQLAAPVSRHSCAERVERDQDRYNARVHRYQEKRWNRLTLATNHIAPYKRIYGGDMQYLAALQVCAAYREGTLGLLPLQLLRDAAGLSASKCHPHSRFAPKELEAPVWQSL